MGVQMIDDAVITELIREAADSVVVPEDGPERILAARSGFTPRVGRTRGFSIPRLPGVDRVRSHPAIAGVGALVAVLVCLGAVAGVPGSSKSGPGPTKNSGASQSGIGQSEAAPLSGLPGAASSGGTGAGTSVGVVHGVTPTAAPVPVASPKVVKTGTMSLQVPRGLLEDVMGRLTDLAAFYSGFVASSSTNVPGGSTATGSGAASGDVTLRVPVASFESLLTKVRQLGTPETETTSGQDVTSQYYDLRARLQSAEDARTQFQQILMRAQSIGDILAVEQQISEVQTQIEQLQGQLNVLTDQASYSTLSVHLTEAGTKVSSVTAPSGISKAWNHARHSFTRGVEAVIAATGGFAVFLFFLGLALLLARVAWGIVRQRLV
jgi:Domain of unknown function (DUF4349)